MQNELISFKKSFFIFLFFSISLAGVAQSFYPIPGTIQAEDFSAKSAVKVESTTDDGGGSNVGAIDANDWMDYNVTVSAPGTYTFYFRVANAYSSGKFQLITSDGNVLGTVSVPRTGDWQKWTTISQNFYLKDGSQTLRILAVAGGWNINWFSANLQQAVISFNDLPARRVEDSAFELTASSTNASVPVTFTSSDPSVVSVDESSGKWMATINGAGTVNITASQQGDQNFLAATSVIKSQVITVRNYKPVPGKIEAEDFDNMSGVATEATSDNGGGSNVKSIDDGDWMDYYIDVTSAGYYNFSARVANPYYTRYLQIETGNDSILATLTLPKTAGWQSFKTVDTTIYLNVGKQTLHLYVLQGQWNFNWFTLTPSNLIPKSTIAFAPLPDKTVGDSAFLLAATSNNNLSPVIYTSSDTSVVSVSEQQGQWNCIINGSGEATITASQVGNEQFSAADPVIQPISVQPKENLSGYKSIPGKIQAESYNAMSGIQTENTSDAGGGQNVSNINDNDWMDYNVNVASAGLYTFNFRVAIPYGSSKIEIRSADGSVSGSANLTPTGGWQTWATVSTTANLKAGNQTIRIYFVKGGFNFNWFEVITGGEVPSVISFSDLPDKMITDAPIYLAATSTNNETPINFSSSDSNIISISHIDNIWKAILVAPGKAYITASQSGNVRFRPAADVVKLQVVQQTAGIATLSKIPMEGRNWYEINTAGDNGTLITGLQQLSDGVLNKAVFMGWAKMFENYDCYYEFKGQQDVLISKIRFFSGDKPFSDKPFKLYAKETLTSQPVLLATFTGINNMQWVEVTLPQPVKAKYLKANVWWGFPNEIELYGSYNEAPITVYPKKEASFKNQLGVNEGIWDVMQGAVDVNLRETLDPTKLKLAKAFTQVRDYIEWEKIEPLRGVYTFQYTYAGGWNYDSLYTGLKRNGIEVLPCLKNVPSWLLTTYPVDNRDAENVPAPYGADLLNPNSYIEQAKAAFQFAARYGSTKVNTSLLDGIVTGIVYPGDPHSSSRSVETGLNLIKYIECENERDKWWKGRIAYQTGFEYAANLSAFYDGNKNTMGPGVGAKNADPNIKVVIGGIAATNTDYIQAIIDWCKQYRGYNQDGTVNLCFDVINYHCYSFQSLASVDGSSTRGAAPEVSGISSREDKFVRLAREFNVEVWMTETGYDLNQGSPLRALTTKSKSPEQVEGDWILRTALLNARHGIHRTFFYQMYDYFPSTGGLYNSSGLLNDGYFYNGIFSRKIAADYVMQAQKLLGDYTYKETLNTDPLIDRYELNGNILYSLVIPDEKDRTADYTLNLGSDSAIIYSPQAKSDTMMVQKVKLSNGNLQITVSETPQFVVGTGVANNTISQRSSVAAKPVDTANAKKLDAGKFSSDTTLVKLYPNPATDIVTVEIQSKIAKESQVQIFETGSGKMVKSFLLPASDYSTKTINVKNLPAGMYTLQVLQGAEKFDKNFLKM